jgi:hypothetical protein
VLTDSVSQPTTLRVVTEHADAESHGSMTRRTIVTLGAAALSGCGGRKAGPAAPARSRAADRGILPAGTNVPIRTVTRIEAAAPGQSFGAVLVGDLVDSSSAPLAGSGAPARLTVRPEGLALSAVMIYGTWHAVSGSDGGPALLGTLVRGMNDTPASGAPVTESMAIRTSGADVQVPGGSLLLFRLDAPARISSAEPLPSR